MEIFKPAAPGSKADLKPETDKNKLEWGICAPQEVAAASAGLAEALRTGKTDLQKAREILSDPKMLRSFVVEGEYDGLQRGLEVFLKEEFGPQADIYSVKGGDMVAMLHRAGLPEQYLVELLDAAFHRKDAVMFYRLLAVIFENGDSLENRDLVLRAEHNRASWKYSIGKDPEASIKANLKVAREAGERGQDILHWKARLGLASQKNLKPKDKASDFKTIAEKMESLDHLYDAHRAKIEEARARVHLASLQISAKDSAVREDNLERARGLIGEVMEYSKKSGYKKLAEITLKLLERYAKESGNRKFAQEIKEKMVP
ncbi:MAG: hypothetical protein Q8L10_02135 [Candidatus Moranbacteria bacterium]|nr:hypothetical protein [Candidatus Moranbacteria bacterium]